MIWFLSTSHELPPFLIFLLFFLFNFLPSLHPFHFYTLYILIKDLELPSASPGDLLAVFTTGAYHYSMSSNYNRLPRPAVVLVNQEKDALMVKRETYGDIVRNDVIPEWLK